MLTQQRKKYALQTVCYVEHFFNLEPFKKEIKTWKSDNCSCRICKVYIESIGFL